MAVLPNTLARMTAEINLHTPEHFFNKADIGKAITHLRNIDFRCKHR